MNNETYDMKSEYDLQKMLKDIAELRRINSLPYTSTAEIAENLIQMNRIREIVLRHSEALSRTSKPSVVPEARKPELRIIK